MNAYVGLNSTRIWEADLSDLETCARIDSFVMARHDSTPFHRPAWSRAIERGTGARAHYLVAERDGYIVAVLPCHEIRSRLFGHALVSSGFAVGGGILGDWPGLAGQMLSLALQKECLVAETRGGSLPPGGWQADDQTYVGFVRDLADDDLSELARMPRKRRAEIRKAMTFGLTHKAGSGINARVMHYRVFSEMVRNLGTPVFPSALFTEVLKAFGQDADILSVFQGETVLASVLTLYHRGTAYPYWGGGTKAARSWSANEYMYYALMCHARHRHGCTRFDFGRSKIGSGAAEFKHNFGFTAEPLCYFHRPLRAQARRDINPNSAKYRSFTKVWRKLPLPIANLIGPFIARGLG